MDLELHSDLSDFRSGAFARVVRSLVEPSTRTLEYTKLSGIIPLCSKKICRVLRKIAKEFHSQNGQTDSRI